MTAKPSPERSAYYGIRDVQRYDAFDWWFAGSVAFCGAFLVGGLGYGVYRIVVLLASWS